MKSSRDCEPFGPTSSSEQSNRLSRRQMLKGVTGALGMAGVAAVTSDAQAITSHKPAAVTSPEDYWQKWATQLEDHRLIRVEPLQLPLRWPRLVGKNARLDNHGYGPRQDLVLLETDRGVRGWGLGWLGQQPKEESQRILAQVKGKPLSELYQMESGISAACPRPLDFSMHDLVGQIVGQPVYALVNPKLVERQPEPVPCYSGMIYFDDLEDEAYPPGSPHGVDRVVANAIADYQAGYRQLKIKIGRGHRWMAPNKGMERDVEITKAIHSALPDVTLLVDANDGYDLATSKAYLENVADVPLLWFEEPFRENVADCKELKQFMEKQARKTYLADGEASPDQELLTKLMQQKAIDVYLTDIAELGFTLWRSKIRELQDLQVLASPHAFGSQLKTYYIAHLAAALGNVLTIEGVPCRSDAIDWNGYALSMDGGLVPPVKHGFGMILK